MKNEFIPYEEALALKELGFDIPVTLANQTAYYRIEKDSKEIDEISCNEGYKKMFNEDIYTLRPLYQQAFRWFREEHDLHIGIYHQVNGKFDCWTNKGNLLENGKYCDIDSYEEAELACLRKLIEMVKDNIL